MNWLILLLISSDVGLHIGLTKMRRYSLLAAVQCILSVIWLITLVKVLTLKFGWTTIVQAAVIYTVFLMKMGLSTYPYLIIRATLGVVSPTIAKTSLKMIEKRMSLAKWLISQIRGKS